MVKHLNACKAVYKECLLPHFPQSQDRFERHFKDSYNLLKRLPVLAWSDADWMSRSPFRSRNPWRILEEYLKPTRKGIDLQVAFTVLRIKPVTILDTESLDILLKKHGLNAITDAGLEVIPDGHSVFGTHTPVLYDPVLAAEILSQLLNAQIQPERIKSAFRHVYNSRIDALYQLLGYTEDIKRRRCTSHLIVESYGEFDGMQYGSYPFSFLVYTPRLVLSQLEAWAVAAALVEDIRKSPPAIYGHARLTDSTGKNLSDISVIRHGDIGNWETKKRLSV